MLIGLLGVCVIVSVVTGLRLLAAMHRYRYTPAQFEGEEPTVSVCIAARNERHALTQSLERILASSYERQEILVLDDASEDDTSMVIKSFAHAGVRFIPGRTLPDGWLGRNHAYQTLANEASGDIVLYLDVDTLIQTHTLRELVAYYKKHQLLMLSVLPRRDDSLRASAIFGTLRHVWEIVVATKAAPPCTSGMWMIDRRTLLSAIEQADDFSNQMRIEHTIAHAARRLKRYRYLIASKATGVRYEKRWHSQVETAQRLYYPLFGGTTIRAVVATAWLLTLLVPVIILPLVDSSLQLLCFIAIVLSMAWLGYYNFMMRKPAGALLKTIAWPVLIVQEFILLLYSIVRYATQTVTWKGRHVRAQPVNHSHLRLN